jgi:TPR repeat protein
VTEALRWFRSAALQGNSGAQHLLSHVLRRATTSQRVLTFRGQFGEANVWNYTAKDFKFGSGLKRYVRRARAVCALIVAPHGMHWVRKKGSAGYSVGGSERLDESR